MSAGTIPDLPRGAEPGWRPSLADRLQAEVHLALRTAIRGIVARLDPAMQSVIVAEALLSMELDGLSWCGKCQATREGICYGHAGGVTLVDALRRHLYTRLPGRPLTDIDL
jgi:hypothetical protein